MSDSEWSGFDLDADRAIAAACEIPAGDGPRGFRLERAGEARVVLEAWGMTEPELLVEVARAVGAMVTGGGTAAPPAGAVEARAVELEAEDDASMLLAWIQRLLAWARRDGFVAADGTLRPRDPGNLTGAVRGRRWGRLPPVSLEPAEDDLLVAATCSRWIARVEWVPSPARTDSGAAVDGGLGRRAGPGS